MSYHFFKISKIEKVLDLTPESLGWYEFLLHRFHTNKFISKLKYKYFTLRKQKVYREFDSWLGK